MAEFAQIDVLRKRKKYLLDKLEKQTDTLRPLTLSCPDKVDKSHSSVCEESGPHRAPLTERNGAQPPRAGASLSTPKTAAKTVQKSGQNIQMNATNSILEIVKTPHRTTINPNPAKAQN